MLEHHRVSREDYFELREREEAFCPIELMPEQAELLAGFQHGNPPSLASTYGVDGATLRPLVEAGYVYLCRTKRWADPWPAPPSPPGPLNLSFAFGPTPATYRHLEWGWKYVGDTPVEEAFEQAVKQYPRPLVYPAVGDRGKTQSSSVFVAAEDKIREEDWWGKGYYVRNRLVLCETQTRRYGPRYEFVQTSERLHWGCIVPIPEAQILRVRKGD